MVDLALISAAYFGANLLRRNFAIDDLMVNGLMYSLPGVLLATHPAFLIAGIYRGIWRYTGLSDGIRFANGAVLAGKLHSACLDGPADRSLRFNPCM